MWVSKARFMIARNWNEMFNSGWTKILMLSSKMLYSRHTVSRKFFKWRTYRFRDSKVANCNEWNIYEAWFEESIFKKHIWYNWENLNTDYIVLYFNEVILWLGFFKSPSFKDTYWMMLLKCLEVYIKYYPWANSYWSYSTSVFEIFHNKNIFKISPRNDVEHVRT